MASAFRALLRCAAMACVCVMGIAPEPTFAQTTQPAAKAFRFGAYERAISGLALPMAAAVARDGTIYVADAGTHEIVMFSREGERLRSFGSLGDGTGQLRSPMAMAIGDDGLIYVADTGNDRVVVFDSTGAMVRQWGGRGNAGERLNSPQGICAAGDRVYVADTGNQHVKVFDASGRLVLDLGSTGEVDLFKRPVDVAVDDAGRLFVLDADRNCVMRFEADGTYIGSWGDFGPFSGLLNNPQGIAIVAGQVFITDTNNHRVQVFAPDGQPLRQWGVHDPTQHEGNGKIHYPQHLAIGGADDARFAVLCEPLEHRCQVFGSLRAGETEAPRQGLGAGDATHYGPRLAIDGRLLLIPEPEHHFVYMFDFKDDLPTLINQFGQRGSKFGMFMRPTGVIVSQADRSAVIADPSLARLQTFSINFDPNAPIGFDPFRMKLVSAIDLSHAPLARPAPGMLWNLRPETMRRDGQGNLHVLDRRNAMVIVFDAQMQFVRAYGAFGSGAGQLREPTDLALVDAGGDTAALVVDAGNFRVEGFDAAGKPTITFGSHGTGDGEFLQPFGIAVDRHGFIYVSDALADHVQKFDASGRFVSAWGTRGIAHGQFWRPMGLAIDDRDRLIVLDHGNHRAQVFALDGTWLATFGGGRSVTRSEME